MNSQSTEPPPEPGRVLPIQDLGEDRLTAMKGSIIAFGAIALALAAVGQALKQISDPDDPNGSGARELAERLPMLSLDAEGAEALLMESLGGDPNGEGGALELPSIESRPSYQMTAEELRERRGDGWVYPAFSPDTRPSARNVTLTLSPSARRLVGEGKPVLWQEDAGGRRQLNGYSDGKTPLSWIFGSPSVAPGELVTFEVQPNGSDANQTWITLLRAPAGVAPIEIGPVDFEVRRDQPAGH